MVERRIRRRIRIFGYQVRVSLDDNPLRNLLRDWNHLHIVLRTNSTDNQSIKKKEKKKPFEG